MKMNKVLKAVGFLASMLIMVAVIYAGAAFITMEVSPLQWSMDARTCFVIFSSFPVIFGLVGAFSALTD